MITWEQWARDWLSGKDRRAASAAKAESAAEWAESAAQSAAEASRWAARRPSIDVCARRAMQ